jgi:hypothetical protein
MNMKVKPFIAAACLVGMLFSCKHEPLLSLESTPDLSKGVFVVNQGTFSLPGSITWHNPETGETVADIYGPHNGGALLGQFVQSMAFIDDKAYIVVNGANKVIIVNASTFEYIDTIGGLALPRYMLLAPNGYAYISQWGADGLTGSLAKIDLNTRKVVGTIPTGTGPEQMVLRNDHSILVANSGGYGVDSTISQIDLITEKEDLKISAHAKNPCCIALATFSSNHYLALCSGSYTDDTPTGRFVRIDDGSGFDLPPYGSGISATGSGDKVFACAGGNVYQWDQTGMNLFFTQPAYCIRVSPKTGAIYCGDAKDFSGTGEVAVYSAGGQKISTFKAGIAPGQIILRE